MTFPNSLAGVLAVLLLAAGNVRAQAGYRLTPVISSYAQADYRAARQSWAVAQDEQGIVYVANSSGMLEFDGKRWMLHRLNASLGVRSVACPSRSQRIYGGAFEEFGYWERDLHGTLHYRSLSALLPAGTLHNDEVWSIFFAGDTVIFRSFYKYFLWHNEQLRVGHFPEVCIALGAIGAQLYAATTHGLMMFAGGQFRLVAGGEQLTDGRQVASMLPFDKRRLLLVTQSEGLFLYDGKTLVRWHTDADRLLAAAQANRVVALGDSAFVVGTILNGAIAIGRRGKLLWHLNNLNGLPNNTVLGLLCDRDRNLWLALDNGIAHAETSSQLYFYSGVFDNVEAVYAIAEKQNALYLATNKGVFRCADGEKSFALIPETQGQAWDLADCNGQLLCGHNEGTFRIDGNRATPISTITGGYCIRPFASADGDTVLIQSTYTHLVVYRRNPRGWWQQAHVIPQLVEPLRYLEIDRWGNLWAAHIEKGIFRLRLNRALTGVELVARYSTLDAYGAGSTGVFKLNDRIVFTTGKMLFTYDDLRDTIVPYEVLNRALGDYATASKIVPDGTGGYWFACRDKLACIELAGDKRRRVAHRIPYSALKYQVNAPNQCVYTAADGECFIGLNNGFAVLNRRRSAPAPAATISLRSVEATVGDSVMLQTLADSAPAVLLPPSCSSVRFAFACPSFAASAGDVQLWCKLVGLESEWTPAPPSYEKEYSRLPAGKYTLALQATSPDGEQLAQAHYSFGVMPQWYATTLARIGFAALGVVAVLLLYKVLLAQIRRQHRRAMRAEAQKRAEALAQQEQKMVLLKNEQLEADVIYKAKELAASAMSIAQKNNLLLQLKQELQKESGAKSPKNIIRMINKNLSPQKEWEVFEANFDLIHDRFFRNLKERWSSLTSHDLKLCAYLRLNLSTKEIAQLTGNSVRGVEVARYRLRRKLNLPTDQNLNEFMLMKKDV
jgi:DNA-binding CsgD family transcriptional regulator